MGGEMEIEDAGIDIGFLRRYISYAKSKVAPRLIEVNNITIN